MNKDEMKLVEKRLYNYYTNKKQIINNKKIIEMLYKHKEQIENEMRELKNLSLEAYKSMGVDYSAEKSGSSHDKSGEAEKEVINYISKLEKDVQRIVTKISAYNSKIRYLELEDSDIDLNLNMLSNDCIYFIELKYKKGKSMDYIATEMFFGVRSTAYRKKEEIIENISNWIDIFDSSFNFDLKVM